MRTLCFVVVLGLCAPVLAQEPASAPQPDASVDKIVVPGRRPENLRVEIERLEGAVYKRWNALNSNDELDITCLESEPTGSNITVRRCVPNFVIQAESRAARNSIVDSRTGTNDARNPTEFVPLMEQKSRELTEEMQRVAREDEELMRDLLRLDELKQLQANERGAHGTAR
jgi:hypothetical protein